jgi:Histidine kinase-, DNA gyrase B-, and HSP90-like ATPase/GAF domain
VADVLSDPLWEGAREVAQTFGFRACWSVPILSSQRKVLGSFAMYGDHARTPSGEELRLMDIGAYIAGIAIERLQAHQALHQSEERNRAILRAIPDWMFVMSADGVFLHYHAKDPAKLTTADDEFVDVAISDCGIGIPVNQLNAVFEPFVTFRPQGLGLGLAISRSIVISHGGRITAENNHDRGVTLRCRFPISQPVPPD